MATVTTNARWFDESKIAIIAGWWWMMSSYSVGSALALHDVYGLDEPWRVIAGSWSAGTMSYYVSQQFEFIQDIRENYITWQKFINFKRFRQILDLDYLVDDVFGAQVPLNTNKIKASQTELLFPALNQVTWNVDYLDIQSLSDEDVYKALKATKAIPWLYNKKVMVWWHHYADSYNSSQPWLHIEKCLRDWYEKIIVLDNVSTWNVDVMTFLLLVSKRKWWIMDTPFSAQYYAQNLLRKQTIDSLDRLEWEWKVFRLAPSDSLPYFGKKWILNAQQDVIKRSVAQWYDETANAPWLLDFLHR